MKLSSDFYHRRVRKSQEYLLEQPTAQDIGNSAEMLHTQDKGPNFSSNIREHEVQGCVSRNLPAFLAISSSWIKGFATPYETHLAHIVLAIATLPQYAIIDEFITKNFEVVAFSYCTRGPSGMKSLGGCISDEFKMGNISIPIYLQMTRCFLLVFCSILMTTHPIVAHFLRVNSSWGPQSQFS